jgi:hypothetical protein
MAKHSLAVLLIYGWLVVGCSSQESPALTFTAPAVPSQTRRPPSAVPFSTTPVPPLTPGMPSPSATPTPSWELTFTPLAQTAQAALQQTNSAYDQTQVVSAKQTSISIVKALRATVTPRNMQIFISPDSNWKAEVVIYDCTQIVSDEGVMHSFEILKISGLKSQKEWTVETQLLNCHGIGAGGLGGMFWAPNSRYFYYTTAREGVPDGGPAGWVRPVSRFNLSSGQILPITSMQLSADGLKMAGGDGEDLVVWNLNGEEQVRFKGKVVISRESANAWVRYIAWSPDGHTLAYILNLPSDQGLNTSFLVQADLNLKQASLLLESSSPEFVKVYWKDRSHLVLWGWPDSIWDYDLVTRLLIPAPESSATPGI